MDELVTMILLLIQYKGKIWSFTHAADKWKLIN